MGVSEYIYCAYGPCVKLSKQDELKDISSFSMAIHIACLGKAMLYIWPYNIAGKSYKDGKSRCSWKAYIKINTRNWIVLGRKLRDLAPRKGLL